jgi:hypothetical protein
MGKTRNARRILVGKPLGICSLGRLRRWSDNIKMDLGEMDCWTMKIGGA